MNKLFVLLALVAFVSCQTGKKAPQEENLSADPVQVVETTISIGGMHCDMCVASVEKGVNELKGIETVKVSLNDSNAIVRYDASKVDQEEIEQAIEKRGYKVRE